MKTLLVTGGAGFIGSNFIRYLLKHSKLYRIINFDALTYAGNLENLKDIEENENYRFIQGNINNIEDYKLIDEHIDFIVNFAAETHVDRSIMKNDVFFHTNVLGVSKLLDFARDNGIEKFIEISTDEVYGDIKEKNVLFNENSMLNPGNPYAVSKASGDMLVLAYKRTFNLNVIITRSSNNYGPYQFPEKFIPLVIYKALNNEKIPLYGDGENIRDWIYVEDNCRVILSILEKGEKEIYNIGVREQRSNIEIVKIILDILKKPKSLISFVKDRPGHDRRYGIDPTLIESELNFKRSIDFMDGIKRTVEWYKNNYKWLEHIISGEFIKYYNDNYKNR